MVRPDPLLTQLDAAVERIVVPDGERRLTWRRIGAGPPMLLLHGGHGSWLHWARNILPWARGRTLWLPDLPGYGDSDPPPEPTLPSLLAMLARTLDTLLGAAQPLAVAGFSFGALVAAELAAARGGDGPLILLGPAGHGLARRFAGRLLPWRDAAARHDDAAFADRMRRNLAAYMFHAPATADATAVCIHGAGCLRARFDSRPGALGSGLRDALRRHRGPLLLAWGEHDVTAIPADAAHVLGADRAACRAEIVAGAGHWVQYERPDAVNALVAGWLDALPPSCTPPIRTLHESHFRPAAPVPTVAPPADP